MTFLRFLLGPRRQPGQDITAETAVIVHSYEFPFDPVDKREEWINHERIERYEARLMHAALRKDPDKCSTEESVARRADLWRERVEADQVELARRALRMKELMQASLPIVFTPGPLSQEVSPIESARKRQRSN